MEAQIEKVQLQPVGELGPDCLCPPVCFQYPPPFCLPCGPGPGGVNDGGGDSMPAPRQCGPFIMLNTPTERKTIILPMLGKSGEHHRDHHRDHHHDHHEHHHDHHEHHRDHHDHHHDRQHDHHHDQGKHGHHRHNDADCCERPHHHHHGADKKQECCEEEHHHHHHYDEDDYCKQSKQHKKHDDDSKSVHEKSHKMDQEKEKKGESRREKKRAMGKSARTNSRELRAGKLLVGCDCEKRNGLQDECQRSLCQGSPECRTIPPTCIPSAFSNGKHLAKRRALAEKKIKDKYKLTC